MKDDTEERRQFYMDKLGVQQDRLIFVPKQPSEADYLRLFSRIDIVLDPFPYSGTTTTCKALDASIPVITKYHKDYHAHNVSASLLTNLGFNELVAFSDDEYIAITKQLVENPCRIDEYKRTINPKFVEMMEPRRFIGEYENLLSELYEKSMNTVRR
jgi:predicted O-linked N-acetylglucosamine transferase (SPINDLY family)